MVPSGAADAISSSRTDDAPLAIIKALEAAAADLGGLNNFF